MGNLVLSYLKMILIQNNEKKKRNCGLISCAGYACLHVNKNQISFVNF